MLQCKWSVTSYTLFFFFARVMVAGKENGNVEWAPNSPTAAAAAAAVAVSSHARIIAESIQSDRSRKKEKERAREIG